MSRALGKTKVVLYIHKDSLLNFLNKEPVEAFSSSEGMLGEEVSLLVDYRCIKLEDAGTSIFVTCEEILKSHVFP